MYRGGGYTAEVKRVSGRYMLAVRNRRGQLVKRRWYQSRVKAMDVMWTFILEEDAA